MHHPKIELRNIGKTRNGTVVLKDINLKLMPGRKHIIVGPSGAGKTTLLRLLNRMDDPTSGDITFDGSRLKDIPVLVLRKKVGMVFQIPVIFEGTRRDSIPRNSTRGGGVSGTPHASGTVAGRRERSDSTARFSSEPCSPSARSVDSRRT